MCQPHCCAHFSESWCVKGIWKSEQFLIIMSPLCRIFERERERWGWEGLAGWWQCIQRHVCVWKQFRGTDFWLVSKHLFIGFEYFLSVKKPKKLLPIVSHEGFHNPVRLLSLTVAGSHLPCFSFYSESFTVWVKHIGLITKGVWSLWY